MTASQQYPAQFAARVAEAWASNAETLRVYHRGGPSEPDSARFRDEWRDADMHRVSGLLRRAALRDPWV